MKKVLNLYAGIGGNRKLWEDVKVVAVENQPEIAKFYQKMFPNDKVIIADAHQFLLEHFKEFDFIWSSPPCPSHSIIRKNLACNVIPGNGGRYAKPLFPDMKLYEEIIFLQHYFKGKWVVENVVSYYNPLIKPVKIQRHWFWANFPITKIKLDSDNIKLGSIGELEKRFGFDLSSFKSPSTKKNRIRHAEKDKLLRNCVLPQLGLHILNCARDD